ncbi:MAG: DUF983 domain-containing protein [Planctomycetota bacterium]
MKGRALFFRRVLGRRCPQCGQGELFRRWARLHERCGVCGLVYRREQGAMTGSMYLAAVATEIVAAGIAVALFFGTSWSPAVAITVGLALHFVFAAWFFPRSMALWVAIEYATDVQNGEWWARPR